ncbi:helix-turn-helix domain protein [Bacillus clarus]|uniref:Helix-turn-helix domain protein n=1 Tax=Bacillus clarus TaxID=2338372 RepID=A0A090YUF4_9BACI|nr:helix-turn-helix domain protein [Bacillus clarus]
MSVGVSLHFLYTVGILLKGEVQPVLVNKAYKFRIYPNKEQEMLIAKTIGCSRFVFNCFLTLWNETIKKPEKD